MCSSRSRSIRKVISATGVPLLAASMVLAAGVALWLGVGSLLRRMGVEGFPCVVSEYVWIFLWVLLAEAAAVAAGIVVFRLLARRISRPVEKFAAEVDGLVRSPKPNHVCDDTRIAELDRLAQAFNRLQTVRARQAAEIRDLARNVLHDLRAPIANIYNESDRLFHDMVEREEASAAIMSASRSLLRIIDTNAEISRNYSGCEDTPSSSVDLAEVVRESVEVYSAVAEEKGVCIKCVLPESPVRMEGHVAKLQRLVGNLLDNAVKFTPGGGSVSVELVSDEKGIRLTVSDTGVGIPKSEIDFIYERFYRCSDAKSVSGTGLGLSMVHSIVEFYNGNIDCQSSVGCGTSFFISFPPLPQSTAV